MIFTSLTFCLFLALTLALFYAVGARGQRLVLLGANYLFYMWVKPVYALLLLAGSGVTWLCARAVQFRLLGRRRLWAGLGVLLMLGQLVLFKYADFFLSGAGLLFGWDHTPVLGLALPIGISFYSFAAAGYLMDVCRGKVEAEDSFCTVALFLSFFPSVLSGPIPRAEGLLPQFGYRHRPDFPAMRRGLLRFVWGACKKLVAADNLLVMVSAAYAAPDSFTGGQWLFAAACYSLYIYLDFSSYTDMAIGAAGLLGFRLPENFHAPYLARTVREFWRRWHISLTSWFRDYLFLPLGGSRKGGLRTCFNILIVFAVSGLWHGAAVTFVIWGLLNGLYQVAGLLVQPRLRSLGRRLGLRADAPWTAPLQILFVFALISASWIFFRADSTGQAVFIIKRILLIFRDGLGGQPLSALGLTLRRGLLLAAVLVPCGVEELWRHRGRSVPPLEERPWLYCLTLAALLFVITLFGAYGPGFDGNEFVYFQF